MRKRLLVLALGAFFVPASIVAGCGGVPGNAVAEVDGNAIEKASFDHWLTVASRAGGQAGAAAPKPPKYTACIAQKRKTTPKPAKGQPKVTDGQLKTQCKQEYNALRDQVLQLLVSFEWIEGEAKEQNIKVTDKEIQKTFDKQKKEAFPKEADFAKFLKDSGQTEKDIIKRVRLDTLSMKIREKVTKGKDKVSDAQIAAYYNKNKERFAQPEQRDLRIVLTKGEAKAKQAKQALERGQSFKAVAKKYSIDQASKAQGGKLPAVAKGQQEKALDTAIFKAEEGRADRPGQDPVRLLRLRGHEGHPRLAADAGAGEGDDQADARVPEPAEGARQVRQVLPQALEGKDRLRRGLPHAGLQERPEGDPDAVGHRPRRHGPDAAHAHARRQLSDPKDSAAAVERLDALTRRLREECPWDREQDERSIVPHTVEEAYELAAAAHSGDDAKLLDELGDVLFQVHFLSLLLEERGGGSLAEVAEHCRQKLIRRHPHVFGSRRGGERRRGAAQLGRDQAHRGGPRAGHLRRGTREPPGRAVRA